MGTADLTTGRNASRRLVLVPRAFTRTNSAVPLRTIAYLLAALSAVATALGTALTVGSAASSPVQLWPDAVMISGFGAAAVGAIIVYHQPRNAVAWLLVASGASASMFVLADGLTRYGLAAWGGAGWLPWSAWVTGWAWIPTATIAIAYLPQVFPNARPMPGLLWRVWWRSSLGAGVLLIAFVAAAPVAPNFPELANPIIGSYVTSDAMAQLFSGAEAGLLILFLVLSAGAIVSIIIRFIRSDGRDRRKIGLVSIASAILIAASNQPIGWLSGSAVVVYLGAILYAVARHGLWDIGNLVSRAAVGIVLLILLGTAFVATVAAIGAIFGQASGSVVAAFTGSLVVAALFSPVQRRVRTSVERAFALGRPDARALGIRMSSAARGSLGAQQSVDSAAHVIASELHTPDFAVTFDNRSGSPHTTTPDPRSSQADSDPSLFILPVRWQQETLGHAILPPRSGAQRVHPADRRVLIQLEPALAMLVHDAVLTLDLELSRRAVVTAREEERRRLRRDLHDGLGPLLAGAALSIGVARDGMLARPDAAADLMGDAASDLDQAIRDIRELVHGLRPPALDDLGLLAAIGTLVPAETLQLRVDAVGDLARMPAAVEVATFRIVQEALTNVMRHARATAVVVTLLHEAQGTCVTITDDGIGPGPTGSPPGVGTVSMAERAAELGGTLTVTPALPRGTIVRAFLPTTRDSTPVEVGVSR
ncbi:MAG TPA: histidine kinase [Microbacteriaceae bacterium]